MTIWVMIPARDEAGNIAGVITGLGNAVVAAGQVPRFVVVDDGSRDGTAALARDTANAALMQVISLPRAGIGAAFAAGINAVLRQASDNDLMLIAEGDGTSDPAVMPELLRGLRADADVVIASRFCAGGGFRNFGVVRRLQSVIVNRLFAVVARIPGVQDYTIFYRGYRVSALRRAWPDGNCRLDCQGFAANTELLLRSAAGRPRITEVPHCYDYSGKRSFSQMPVLTTVFGHLRLLLSVAGARCHRPGQ